MTGDSDGDFMRQVAMLYFSSGNPFYRTPKYWLTNNNSSALQRNNCFILLITRYAEIGRGVISVYVVIPFLELNGRFCPLNLPILIRYLYKYVDYSNVFVCVNLLFPNVTNARNHPMILTVSHARGGSWPS